jgi:signal transduction histidine kinase
MFDPRTALLCLGILYIFLPLNAWLSLQGHRSIVVKCWIGSTILAGFAIFLIAARGFLPDLISIAFGSGLLITTIILRAWSLLKEADRPFSIYWVVGLSLVVLLSGIGLHMAGQHLLLTIFNRSCLSLSMFFLSYCAWVLWRRSASPSMALIGIVTFVVGIAFAAQTAVTVFYGGFSPVDNHAAATTLIYLGLLSVVVTHVGIAGFHYDKGSQQLILAAEQAAKLQQRKLARRDFAALYKKSSSNLFLLAIIHQFNQPLTSILIHSQILLREFDAIAKDPGKFRNLVERIVTCTEKLIDIPKRLRELAGAEDFSGHQANLFDTVTSTIDSLEHEVSKHKAVVSYTGLARELTVRGEKTLLSEALQNVLVNALDSMSESPTKEIKIIARQDLDRVFLDITDTGAGLGADQIDEFGQLFTSSKRGGLGSGVALAKHILNKFDGDLSANNRDPAGLCVTVNLALIARASA